MGTRQFSERVCSALVALAALAPSACQTTSPAIGEKATAPKRLADISPKVTRMAPSTVLPPVFDTDAVNIDDSDAAIVLAPAGALSISEVVRPRAEVRSGPGAQFEVADKVLAQGTPVLAFNKVGVWRKVVVMATSQTGWVHTQALSEPKPNEIPMRVDLRRLPTVQSARDVTSALSFPQLEPLAPKVPRGFMFRSLRYADGGTLVWLPETKSVMWLARKDVQ